MAGTQSVGALTSLSGVSSGIPTALVPTAVPDWLDRVKNAKTPFLNAITKGSAPSRMTPKLTWGWSSNRIMYDQLAASYSTTGTTLTVDNQNRFQIGDVIQIEAELFRVTAYVSTNQLTVQYAQGGTTNANHADNSGIQIIGPSVLQNADTQLTPIMQGEILTNEWQQIEYMLSESQMRSAFDSFENAGKGDALTYFAKKLMNIEGPINAERMLIHNLSQAQTASVGGIFGGALQPAYTSNRISVSGALTMKAIMDGLEASQLVSEEPVDLTVVGHPRMLRRISSMFSGTRMANATDDTIKLHFEKFQTPYGMLTFMPTPQWTQPGTVDGTPEKELNSILICNPKDFVLRPAPDSAWTLDYRDNPYNSAWQKIAYLRGIYSLEAQNIYTRTYLYGFSTTDSDYPSMI